MDESIFRTSRLCVVGNINRDIKTAPFMAAEGLLRDGETSVASVVETVGGGGANSSFAAAALGAKVAFLGKVGADALGNRLEQALKSSGIAAHLARDQANATGTSINLSYESGQRHFVSCLPNNESLAFDDLVLETISDYDHLLRADIWFSDAMLFGGNERLFQIARAAGVAVSVDLNWDPCWGRMPADRIMARKQAVRDVLPHVSLAHGNVRELNEFADATDLKTTLRRLEDWGAGAVVVHLGSEGAGYYLRGDYWTAPAIPSVRPNHSTGTGDVLSVCMMLMHGQDSIPVPEKLRLANTIVSQFIAGARQLIPQIG
jgi:sugar/nucleoside kinase (ribokinase family)